jgi:hypothetical protein
MDRAFRIGQQRTVEVYRLIGLGTLEELKYERQSEFAGPLRLSNELIPVSPQAAARPTAQPRHL